MKSLNMEKNKKLIEEVTQILDDAKGDDILILPVDKLSTEFETMIICTGTSARHVNSLADYVTKGIKDHYMQVHTPKRGQEEWVVVDAGDLVVHLMTATARDFYRLENLWQYHPNTDE